MRAIKDLNDVQIVLRELLDRKDRELVKAKDQRGLQIKNGGDATDPQDFVTLRQLESAFPPGSKVAGTTIISKTTSGGGGTGPVGPAGPAGPQGPPGTSGVANAVQEVPSGVLNSTNTVFTTSATPIANTLVVELNGVSQNPFGDVSISGSTITFLVAPKATDWLVTYYFR